ncbi:MAG: hypothetical protein CLLPBCKN_003862 [Chroococcidiopsis cubana SAG 39.79]|nr:hypothetical protein [Chroococcidiopsis cubana]MDZ4874466.1 hypothetical protein [Chroococcidiopsis cubana SAG 39.79]
MGLWKQGLLQDRALEYIGTAELLDFDIPTADIHAVLEAPKVKRVTSDLAIATLPLTRPPVTTNTNKGIYYSSAVRDAMLAVHY